MQKAPLITLLVLLFVLGGGFALLALLPQKESGGESGESIGWRDSSYVPQISSPTQNAVQSPPLASTSSASFEPIILPRNIPEETPAETGGSRLLEFFSGLGGTKLSTPLSINEASLENIFETGLIPAPPVARTERQEALYRYGNKAGAAILAHEEAYGDTVRIFETLFENGSSTSAVLEARALADSLGKVGDALLAISEVPHEAKETHANLGETYRVLGPLLHGVINASGDTTRLESMLAYNTAAEEHTRAFVSLASLLSTEGVHFEKTDLGRVFVFPQ